MPNHLENTERSMSADLLQDLFEAGHLSKPELQQLLQVGRSTAYEYFGHRELRWGQIKLLLRYAKADAVREKLLGDLSEGTRYIVYPVDPNLDINGDGVINEDDEIDALADLMHRSAESLKRIRTDNDRQAAVGMLDDVIRLCVCVRNIEAYLADRRVKIKPREGAA